MEMPAAWHEACVCGRTFYQPQAYSFHQRNCKKTKKRLAGALEKAKEIWQAKKRRKIEGESPTEGLPVMGPTDLSAIPNPLPDVPYIQQVRFPLRLTLNLMPVGNILTLDHLEPSTN
jgi:hypothetical protein